MQITINVPDTITVNVRGFAHDVNTQGWATEGYNRVFLYGLQRIHNDACGTVGKDESDKEAKCLAVAGKVTDSLRAGTGRTRVSSSPRGDEVAKEALAMAERTFMAVDKAKRDSAIKATMEKAQVDEKGAKRAILNKLIERDGLRAAAEKVVAARREAKGESDVTDLSDLI